MTSIEENAHQYASEKCDCDGCIRECTEEWRKSMDGSCDYYNRLVRFYIEIATEQQKIDIDKACDWIEENLFSINENGEYNYVANNIFGSPYIKIDLFREFRKAMEDNL